MSMKSLQGCCTCHSHLKLSGLLHTRPGSGKAPITKCVVCVRGMVDDLLVDELSRHLGASETKCMSSSKYGGAWPEKDKKTTFDEVITKSS